MKERNFVGEDGFVRFMMLGGGRGGLLLASLRSERSATRLWRAPRLAGLQVREAKRLPYGLFLERHIVGERFPLPIKQSQTVLITNIRNFLWGMVFYACI